MPAQITISSESALIDEPLSILLSGLPPKAFITLTAQTSDYACINAAPQEACYGDTWQAHAVFESDACGRIDLAQQAPLSGDYSGADAMGLFYAMQPQKPRRRAPRRSKRLESIPVHRGYHVTFSATFRGQLIASQTCQRLFSPATIHFTDITQQGFVGRFFYPADHQRHPAVLVLSGSDGRIEKAQLIAQLLAAHGYAALALCYFGLTGSPSALSQIDLEPLEKALAWLSVQAEVLPDKLALYGRSKGGELALLAASCFPSVTAVVANTPSCYCYEGISRWHLPSRHSSWRYRGQELPYIAISPSALWQMALHCLQHHPNSLRPMYQYLFEHSDKASAMIPLERINGPILLLSAEFDDIWPSRAHAQMAFHYLQSHHFPHSYRHICYATGHMLTLPYQAIPTLQKSGGNLSRWAQSSQDSWQKTLEFFKRWQQSTR